MNPKAVVFMACIICPWSLIVSAICAARGQDGFAFAFFICAALVAFGAFRAYRTIPRP